MLNLALAGAVCAQDHTILFDTGAAGVSAAMTNWGLDTCWPNFDNMQRGLIFMGTNNVNIVRVGFFVDAPLTNNDVTPADKAAMQTDINLAGMATAAKRWDMNWDSGVDAWYQSGANTVYPNRWAAAIEACQRYYKRNIWAVEGFNEPDFLSNNEGSSQDLYNIFGYLQASTNFPGTSMEGGSTLNDDLAQSWFSVISPKAAIGSTHCLAGSASSYVNFIQSVAASGAMPFNPELHNVCEAIMGVNYGLEGGIWWGTAERARGDFVQACQGRRLGYADDLNNWTAAAVYRGTNGSVQAFLGGSERMATTTGYQFFAQDRDVFYDGYGPQRAYTVTVPGGNGYQVNQPDAEQVVNINWGADVQPPVNGRYIVVNRNSGLVLQVPGASTANGTVLNQGVYTGALNQQWDINPMPNTSGGDCSYFSIKAAHDGVNADDFNFSYSDGSVVGQWNGGTNVVEQWYLEYAGSNYFRIHNRWSAKVMDVNGASMNADAQIVQWDNTGGADQEWRLIPATVSTYDFTPPAAPTGVSATANAASVQLNWNQNTETDLASYTVLRSTTNGGPYDIVARGLTNNSFMDNSANLPLNYYYVVQAVDRSLNTSADSLPVAAEPTGAPAVIADYTFDGNFSDSSGNGNNPIVTNGAPMFVAGKHGFALGLDGGNQSLLLPAGLLASATNFTIAAWVYWNGGNAWQRIFDFGNGTSQYLFLTPNSGNGTLRFAVTVNGGGTEQVVETTEMASNRWVHVAVTYDGGTARLYTNGMLAAAGAVNISPASFNPALNYLGQSQYPADPFFSGALDEVQVANYAMSSAQIAGLVASVPPGASGPLPVLMHRYTFNETGGDTVPDSIGGPAWNGTLPNGGTFAGGHLSFSAASRQYLNLPGGILGNDTAATIDLWVPSISGSTTSPPFDFLFFFGDTDGGGSGYNYIFFNPNVGRAAISAVDPGYDGEQGGNLAKSLGAASNLHLTCVFDPPDGLICVYTNGVLAAGFTGITDPLSVVGNQFAYIGRSLYTSDSYLTWSIQELRIYNGAMSAADVAGSQIAGPNVLLTTNVTLATSANAGKLALSWPVSGSGFTLASSPTLGSDAVWTPVALTPTVMGGNYQLNLSRTNGSVFYRLQR